MGNENGRRERLEQVTESLGTLMWRGHRQSMVAAEEVGLTLPQQSVLLALEAAAGRSTMGDLSRLTHQNMATLTGVVDRLIKLGLVERRRNEDDRRVVQVGLTPAGQERMVEARRARQADVTQMVAAFSDDEIRAFDHLLRKFMDGMAAMTHTALNESETTESAQKPG